MMRVFGIFFLALSILFLIQCISGVEFIPAGEWAFFLFSEKDPVNLTVTLIFVPALSILLLFTVLHLVGCAGIRVGQMSQWLSGWIGWAAPTGAAAWISVFSYIFIWGEFDNLEVNVVRFSNWLLFWFFLIGAPAYVRSKPVEELVNEPSLQPTSTLNWFAALYGRLPYSGYSGPTGKLLFFESRHGRYSILVIGVALGLFLAALTLVLVGAALFSPIAEGQQHFEHSLRLLPALISGFTFLGSAFCLFVVAGSALSATACVYSNCIRLPLPHLNGHTMFTYLLPKSRICIGLEDIDSYSLSQDGVLFLLQLKDGNILVLRWGIDPEQAPQMIKTLDDAIKGAQDHLTQQ